MRYFRYIGVSLFALCLSIAQLKTFAQHPEANFWYFGNHAGINFNSGSPVPLGNGQLYTLEGCLSISDAGGNLLFYSHGDSVWDRNHNVMPNGTGLWGHRSSTQSGVVVKAPGSTNLYYIFTASAQMGIAFPPNLGGPQVYNGIAYSVVDMNLNGGMGDVIAGQKNIQLVHPATEKITAVRHCNGRDVWVVTHEWNSNRFFAYLVTSAGVSAPVISAVGLVHQDVGSGQGAEAIGYMKVAPDQQHLALACFTAMNKAELFDFQNVTGVVSNPVTLNLPASPNGYAGPYGVSFSPDGKRMFIGWHDYFGNPNFIFEYDLTAGSTAAILASRFTVASSSAQSFGALQLATDGKLYIAFGDDLFLALEAERRLRRLAERERTVLHLPEGVERRDVRDAPDGLRTAPDPAGEPVVGMDDVVGPTVRRRTAQDRVEELRQQARQVLLRDGTRRAGVDGEEAGAVAEVLLRPLPPRPSPREDVDGEAGTAEPRGGVADEDVHAPGIAEIGGAHV